MNETNAPKTSVEELYQEVIVDHNRNPRNFKEIPGAALHDHAYNPLCGDDYELYLNVDAEGKISDVGFQGKGCAISKASASMMTSKIKGKSREESKQLAHTFLSMITQGAAGDKEELGSLKIFEGVRKFPVRVKCATMIWHSLEKLLKTHGGKHAD